MALSVLSVPRASAPHLPSLSEALAPILAAANAGSFFVRYQGGNVIIEQASFSGVNLAAVDAAVAAAPEPTAALQAQFDVDAMPVWARAMALAIIDQLNVLRQNPAAVLPAITPAQAIAAIRNKAGSL